jgi:radical SAM superfamily enzyme YgiQ (UPF0313 family)
VAVTRAGIPYRIKKRIVQNLDEAFYPTKHVVPYISIIHDRFVIEIMRGCMHRCRFCQARSCYTPVRTRSKKRIMDLVAACYNETGYEEFSLMSLSSGDYPGLIELMKELLSTKMLLEGGVGISLPSLRVEDVLSELPQVISKMRKTGLTFAPEAGTERLRTVIGKQIDMGKLFDAVTRAQCEGWRRVKLYFMIGLPTESSDDIDGIISLLNQVRQTARTGAFDLAVSIASFIPKPHTPFQWSEMDRLDELVRKQQYLRARLGSRRLTLKFHNPELSFLEAVFSRGDRRLAKVLMTAYRDGAHFDSWDEFFKFDIWMNAFRKNDIDPTFYTASKEHSQRLPWDHIDVGIATPWLLKEAEDAYRVRAVT